jgi:hypothetical protein
MDGRAHPVVLSSDAYGARASSSIGLLEGSVKDEAEAFIEQYSAAVLDGNAAVFAGAGLSIPAGLVDWKALLRDIARDIGLDVRREDDLISIAQYHVNSRRGRHRINQQLLDEFSKRASITDNHRLLASLPIRTYWTTNYDTLVEDSIKDAGKTADVKRTVANLALTVHRADAVVYKMHGDISLPDQAVITKDDYETYDDKRHLFSMALQGDLVSKTFLFIGFSFSDPNLNYILGRIRRLLGENRRQHYALLRRVHRRDFPSAREFHYAQAKQTLQVDDLQRYGIRGVLVDAYSKYEEVLRTIRRTVRTRSVFISGSAVTYKPWTDLAAERLLHEIGTRFAAENFTIVSGFGQGVGPFVLNGVLDRLEQEGTKQMDGRVVLQPFPIAISDPVQRRHRWTEYRNQLLTEPGIAVFLFGNKNGTAGRPAPAEGMIEEFEIAVASGIYVIPVGATESTARVLYDRVVSHYQSYFPHRGLKGKFAELGRVRNPATLAAKLVGFASALRDAN